MKVEYDQGDLNRILRKCDPKILADPLKRFFDRAGIAVTNQAKLSAPVDTGRMRASLGKGASGGIWDQDTSAPPLWLKVGTNVNHRGFSYPFALDNSDRYHYRGTHPNLRGKPTQGWFSSSLEKSVNDIRRFLATLGREIRQNWDDK